MKRIAAWILVLLMFGFAYADVDLQAVDLAAQMSEYILCMADVKQMPLENGAQNRAIWTDTRTGAKCSLSVYPDADAAKDAALELGTRNTSARPVGNCLLEIDADLAPEHVDTYCLALADVLGVQLPEEAPDYILNVNTRKFHKPSCASVDEMKESNKQPYTGEKATLEAQGYAACKRCKP